MADADQWSDSDLRWMQQALKLAQGGLFSCDPNPRVGCVLVKDGQLVGQGYHQRAGSPHAERVALAQAGQAAQGASCYVTLEPCCHQGRTGPCSQALIEAGVARVIAAVKDPNPRVAGEGMRQLQDAGIDVSVGLMESEARALNPGFFARMSRGAPWVRVKVGSSLDGRTALANGKSSWITSAQSREDVQHWRARSSAIVTGIGTVLSDDPRMNVRLNVTPSMTLDDSVDCESAGAKESGPAQAVLIRQPVRVVMDTRYRTPANARLFESDGPVWIVGGKPSDRNSELAQCAEMIALEPSAENQPSLPALMKLLAEREINEVLVEAGAILAGAFLEQGLVDELLVYLAPSVLGHKARGMFAISELTEMAQRMDFDIKEVIPVGRDLRLRLTPCQGEAGD